LIQFVKESSSTNNAAPQGYGSSPQVYENVAKAESALAFSLENEPVQTLAHWIPASRQILDDSAALAAYINSRLTYFLKIKEEDELLNGTGTGGDLNGMVGQATSYNTALNSVGDTKLDTLRHAILQLELSFADCDGIVLHPTDWQDIELTKTTGSGVTSGLYIFAQPQSIQQPRIWGRPVVPTVAMTQGDFLAAQFAIASQIYDRQQNTVEISREHSDFFTKNMVAILAEERLALVTYRPEALISGSFPT
jgi:HK97 family phage major capsid protein